MNTVQEMFDEAERVKRNDARIWRFLGVVLVLVVLAVVIWGFK